MAEKRLNTRIIHKHAVEADWLKATGFTPLAGEIIVYDIDDNYDYERIKVGDGETLVSALPFIDDAVKNSVAADIAELNTLVGDTAVATQISEAIATKADVDHTHEVSELTDLSSANVGHAATADAANSQYAITATSEDGVAYVATVPSVAELTSGVSFIMIPGRVSASTTPTLDVNGLGAKTIRRRLSAMATAPQAGYTATWLAANMPFRVVYDGTQWIVEGHSKPAATDLYGTLPVEKGGTGATTAEEALANLGAASVTLKTWTSADIV